MPALAERGLAELAKGRHWDRTSEAGAVREEEHPPGYSSGGMQILEILTVGTIMLDVEAFGMANMRDKGGIPPDRQRLFREVEQLEDATASQLAESSLRRDAKKKKNIAIAIAALGPDAREASWSRSTRFTMSSVMSRYPREDEPTTAEVSVAQQHLWASGKQLTKAARCATSTLQPQAHMP